MSAEWSVVVTLLLIILTRVEPSDAWRGVWIILLIAHCVSGFVIGRKSRNGAST